MLKIWAIYGEKLEQKNKIPPKVNGTIEKRMLRASCLMLEINEFKCYEAKVEENEKGRQSLGVEPRIPLAWAASALPLTHNSRTITNPHNPLYALHRWYQMPHTHTWQPLSMCHQNSVRGWLENSLHQERTKIHATESYNFSFGYYQRRCGNSKMYLINDIDMDTMYSQYAEAQEILRFDGRCDELNNTDSVEPPKKRSRQDTCNIRGKNLFSDWYNFRPQTSKV